MRKYGIQIVESKVMLAVDPKGVIAGTAQVNTHMQRTLDKTRKAVDQFGYMYLALKRIATYTAIFSFFAKMGQLLGQVVQLELRQAEVATLVDMRNEKARKSYERVIASIRKLPPALGSAIDLTKGLYEIMSAGVGDSEEAFKLLVVSAKYAKGGITDLATAASTLTAVMKAYGYAADEMREKSDAMFAAVMEGKFHAEDFNAALGKVLPTAAAMGVSIEEVSAMMAVLTQRGLDAAQASTSFNRMLIGLLKPMDKAKAKLEMLGIEYGINAFRTTSLKDVMIKLADAQRRYGDILPEIFRRQRGLKAAFISTWRGLQDYILMLDKMVRAQEGEGSVIADCFCLDNVFGNCSNRSEDYRVFFECDYKTTSCVASSYCGAWGV
jgi:TP901 family phage tail tape measure protein